jgi:2-polyprenyl-6-methoxyphenol hydroxylase-like FAD-dependent oxidoreductase
MLLSGRRIAIVGASIAGLSAARELGKLGANVILFERSAHALAGRGAGISMDPAAHAYLQADGLVDWYLPVRDRVFLGRKDRLLWRQPLNAFATTWDALYHALRASVPSDVVRTGVTVESIEPHRSQLRVRSTGNTEEGFELAIGADGIASRTRQLLFPELAPAYAGYVIIRGIVDEAVLDATAARGLRGLYDSGSMLYYLAPHSHALAYLVPGRAGDEDSITPGRRQVNWGWYVNLPVDQLDTFLTDREGLHHHLSVPPGMMPEERRSELIERARALFPPSMAELIAATPAPFEQAIFSCMVPRMVVGGVALLGDAAHLARPHVGSGALMTIHDARALRENLEAADGNIETALQAWDAERRPICARTVAVGDRAGIAHQIEEQDWESLSPADFEAWWAAVVSGEHLYFERRS